MTLDMRKQSFPPKWDSDKQYLVTRSHLCVGVPSCPGAGPRRESREILSVRGRSGGQCCYSAAAAAFLRWAELLVSGQGVSWCHQHFQVTRTSTARLDSRLQHSCVKTGWWLAAGPCIPGHTVSVEFHSRDSSAPGAAQRRPRAAALSPRPALGPTLSPPTAAEKKSPESQHYGDILTTVGILTAVWCRGWRWWALRSDSGIG